MEINEQQIAQRLAVEDAAGRRASAEPLPGPLALVMCGNGDIEVEAVGRRNGKLETKAYKVRPICDADFETLTALKHPIYEMMKDSMEGRQQAPSEAVMAPRGPQAWEIAWILTREPEAVDQVMAKGVDALKAVAKAEFGVYGFRVLAALYQAAISQVGVYWSTPIGYGPEPKEGEANGTPDPR